MAPLEGKVLDMSLDEMIKVTGKGSKGSRKLGKFNAGKIAKSEGQKKKPVAKGDAGTEETAKSAEKKLDMGLDEIIEKDDGSKKKGKGKGGGKEKGGKKGGKDADDDGDWSGGKGKKGGKQSRKGGKGDEWDEWSQKSNNKGSWGSGGGGGGWNKENDWQSQEWKGSGGKSEWGASSWGGGKASSRGGGKASSWGGGKANRWERDDRSWGKDGETNWGGSGSDRGADKWSHGLYDRNSHRGYDREERPHRGYEREVERRPDPRMSERESRMVDDRRGREPSPRRAEPAYAGSQKRAREEPRASTTAKSRTAPIRVEVSNIPKDLDRRDIQDAFEAETGPIVSCDMSAGRAMIVYKHLADAKKAVETFDLGELNNQTIHVKILG